MSLFSVSTARRSRAFVGALSGLFASIILVPCIARAAVSSATYTFDAGTILGFGTFNRTFAANANKFDGSLGTLNSIDVTWSITGSGTGTVNSSNGGSVTLSGGGAAKFDGIAHASFGIGASMGGVAPTVVTATNTNGSFTELLGGVNVPPSVITDAIGNGTGTVPVEYDLGGTSFSGANIDNPSITTSGSVVVAYNYTAIPEPATAGLLGIVAATALVRRPRQPARSKATEFRQRD
jgi:hypothetical protein